MRRTLPLLVSLAFFIAPTMASAATNPVASYGFEETSGSTATDSSGNGNTGTITGATRVTTGKFGKALSFDGTSDWVRVLDSNSLDLTAGMTIEAWVNPMSAGAYRTVVMKQRPGDLAWALYGSGPSTPSAQLTAGAGDYKRADGSSVLPQGTWSHLAATYDGATLRLYINGVLTASSAYSGSLNVSTGDLYIGGNNVWSEWFDGTIDEVRIYDRALAATEIQADMAAPVVAGTPPNADPQPPSPSTVGSWTPPVNWPLVAVHASMLSNGKVAMWDAFGAAMGSERIWDPATGTFQQTPSGLNLFCAGHVLLPDGRLFTAGGHVLAYAGITDTELLNPLTGSWTAGPQMARGRWYPTTTTLPDGRVLIVSGDGISDTPGGYNAFYRPSDTIPEIYDPATNTITAMPSAALRMPLYPFMFVAPDGRVVSAGPDKVTRILNVQTGTWSTLASQSPIDGHSAVMYRPGKILKSGTWADPDFPTDTPVTNRAAVLDLNQTVPTWQEVSPMKWKRTFHTLTVLPTGDVLAMGGTRTPNGNDVTQSAVLEPEIWHPETDTWTSMASSQRPRGYHNISLLLPDGRILLAGSGRLDGSLMPNEQTAEIFSPPYLNKGPRPTITSAPTRMQYGTQFTIDTPDADSIAKVALIRTGSVTHGLNMDQRYMEATFTKQNGKLVIDAPANSNLAPPGVYYVFLVNGNGVPSVAAMLPMLTSDDTVAPSAPTNLTAAGATGKVTLNWSASTDNVAVTKYDIHRSTTAGFTPGSSTLVATVNAATLSYVDSGRSPGTYYYKVVAEDAASNTSTPSNQASGVVPGDTTAPTVSISAPAGGSTVSGTVVVTANASDDVGVASVQFKLDGADLGSLDTSSPYTVNWDTTTATAGSHVLSAVAKDAAGNPGTAANVSVTVNNTTPPGPTPVAAYAFDETSGSSVIDATGKGHTGTITGATRTTTGKTGGALSFNGTSNSVSVPDANDLDLTTGMTLEAWVNPTNNTGWRTAVMKEKTGDLTYALYAGGSTTPLSTITTSAGYGEAPGPAGSAPAVNTWTHLAGTYDGTTLKLYKNGALISSKAVTGSINAGTGPLKIGGNAIWGEWFAGQIDDVRVYNTALTAAQITTDMNTPVGGAPAPDTTAPSAPGTVTATGALGSVGLSWGAATDNVGVDHYNVHRSTTSGFTPSAANRVGTPTGLTFNDTPLTAGTYYYRVFAVDAAGNIGPASPEVSGTALADTTAPSVAVTAPAAGSVVKSIVTVTASASDDVGVAGVQFKLDGAALGAEDTTAPYSVAWDTTAASAGAHVLTAVARDAAGNSMTASDVSVTVDNSVPAGPVPVAAYNFNEASGSTVTDTTGKGHTGTISGATRTTTGKTGGALSFNGTSNFVSVADADDLDLTTGMTLEAWVNPTANTNWRTAVMKEKSGDLSYALYSGGATTPLATITNTGQSGYGEAGNVAGSAPANNTWTHLAGTYDGTTLKLYKNGTLISSVTRAGSIAVGTGPVKIGGNAVWGEWFKGQLDDIRIYNTALTAAQITTDMNTPVS
ncbi:LamG-like jellyroll fold domain-containing protein [Solirubrobacter soli]|uniref:LamG-like jellyroll fold domain-containing protein n=1 Tax=Solirubrobacter soli TaxID=363832 RepID=UPI0004117010|nr:LamG-like jellyroll fold domain-containing protein [Solirubrobacter soli]